MPSAGAAWAMAFGAHDTSSLWSTLMQTKCYQKPILIYAQNIHGSKKVKRKIVQKRAKNRLPLIPSATMEIDEK